ncbi:MAG: histone H1 [Ignavibacteriaceae bacterium]|nr:histone H1 [Ignavibacteriaceae bacterium]
MDQYNKLLDALKNLEGDFQKFYDKGNSAAGTRLRKGLSDLKKLAQDIRIDIQEVKNSRKGSSAE